MKVFFPKLIEFRFRSEIREEISLSERYHFRNYLKLLQKATRDLAIVQLYFSNLNLDIMSIIKKKLQAMVYIYNYALEN